MKVFFIILIASLLSYRVFAQNNKSEISSDLKKKSYFEFSLLGGSPTCFNISGSYWLKQFGVRVSGGYFETDMNGLQLNVNFKLKDNMKHRHNIGIALGKSQDRGCEYSYFGPIYDFTYKKLFVEFGVCKVFNVERGDFSNLPYWIVLQFGYTYRFKFKQ